MGYLVFLSFINLRIERLSRKLDFKFVGPFKVIEAFNDYTLFKLDLPATIIIYLVFYASLLKLDP